MQIITLFDNVSHDCAGTMKKFRSGMLGSQEMFEFDGRLKVSATSEFNNEEAATMALHRRHRIGELALTESTRGFHSKVAGLWVPHSGTENNAVTSNPQTFINNGSYLAKERVIEKYNSDDKEATVPESKVRNWARFAANQEASNLANKYDAWRLDGRDKALVMIQGITAEGYVNRPFIESTTAVMGSIAAYMADLKSYIGHPDMMRGVKRIWLQDKWVKRQAANLAWTQDFLLKQPDWEFDRWYAESFYNHRSRAKYWYEVLHRSTQMREDIVVHKRRQAWKEDMARRGYDV